MGVLCGEHWMFWESLPAPQARHRPSRVTQEQSLVVPALFLLVCLVGSAAAQAPLGRALVFGRAAGCPQCKTKGAAGVQVSSWNAAALPSLPGPSWCLPGVSLLLCEHGARTAAEPLLQIRM